MEFLGLCFDISGRILSHCFPVTLGPPLLTYGGILQDHTRQNQIIYMVLLLGLRLDSLKESMLANALGLELDKM